MTQWCTISINSKVPQSSNFPSGKDTDSDVDCLRNGVGNESDGALKWLLRGLPLGANYGRGLLKGGWVGWGLGLYHPLRQCVMGNNSSMIPRQKKCRTVQ